MFDLASPHPPLGGLQILTGALSILNELCRISRKLPIDFRGNLLSAIGISI